MTLQDLSSLVWAFARLELEDENFFDVLAVRACKLLREDSQKGTNTLLPIGYGICLSAWAALQI